jgi:hypothetical protein
MKKAIALLCMTAALALQPGCTTMTENQKLSLVRTVSQEAAYVGAAYDLQEHANRRQLYVAAVAALDALINREDYSPAALRNALALLPDLRGGRGALLIDAGVSLYSITAGFIDLDSAPFVSAAAHGIRAGIAGALARPTGTATRSLAPALPKQIRVPARPAKIEDGR